MQDKSIYFKVVSLLLQYPDEAYIGALPELKSVVDEIHRGQCRAAIEAFIADVEIRSVLQLQERYTAIFDMSPSTTLNITYHLWGDGEKRARLLTRLQQMYAFAGFERTTAELPDFLPLMLEFMAAVPEARMSETIAQCVKGLETVVDRLREIAPPYAALLSPLADIFKDQTWEQTETGAK